MGGFRFRGETREWVDILPVGGCALIAAVILVVTVLLVIGIINREDHGVCVSSHTEFRPIYNPSLKMVTRTPVTICDAYSNDEDAEHIIAVEMEK